MVDDLTSTPPPCPIRQQSHTVVPIYYGLLRLSEEGKAAAKRGEFVLGGCSLEPENWFCKRCEHRFADWPERLAP